MTVKKKPFKVFGNKVKIAKKDDTYIVDIFLKENIIDSFDSDEEAEFISEKWVRKTFFYLCDEGLLDETAEISQAKVNISVKKY